MYHLSICLSHIFNDDDDDDDDDDNVGGGDVGFSSMNRRGWMDGMMGLHAMMGFLLYTLIRLSYIIYHIIDHHHRSSSSIIIIDHHHHHHLNHPNPLNHLNHIIIYISSQYKHTTLPSPPSPTINTRLGFL